MDKNQFNKVQNEVKINRDQLCNKKKSKQVWNTKQELKSSVIK